MQIKKCRFAHIFGKICVALVIVLCLIPKTNGIGTTDNNEVTLYEYNITAGLTKNEILNNWGSNVNDAYSEKRTGKMDGEISKYYFTWLNSYERADNFPGSTRKERDENELEIYIKNLDIDLSQWKNKDLRLQLDYVFCAKKDGADPYSNGCIDIFLHDSLVFYVQANDGEEYGPFKIDHIYPTGIYERKFSSQYDAIDTSYDIISENILSEDSEKKIPDNSRIVGIKIMPYANMPWLNKDGNGNRQGLGRFMLGGAKVFGLKNGEYKNPKVSYEKYNKEFTINNIVNRMYDIATVKWYATEDLQGDSGGVKVKRLSFDAETVFYGVPYGQISKTSPERFKELVNAEKLSNDLYNFASLDCSSSVFEATSVYIPFSFAVNMPRTFIWNHNVSRLLGNIEHTGGLQNERNTNTLREKYSKQDFFEAYGELEEGDILGVFASDDDSDDTNYNHVRLVTGVTHVERGADGKIDGEKSYVVTTEQNSSTLMSCAGENCEYNTYNIGMMNDEAIEWTPNPNYTDLRSLDDLKNRLTTWMVNRKYTFNTLYGYRNGTLSAGAYVPLRLLQNDKDQIETLHYEVINANTTDNLKNGLKGTIVSNYKINSVKYSFIKDDKILEEIIEYPGQIANVRPAHNIYSLYLDASADVKEAVKNFEEGIFTVTISSGAKEKEVLRLDLRSSGDDEGSEEPVNPSPNDPTGPEIDPDTPGDISPELEDDLLVPDTGVYTRRID